MSEPQVAMLDIDAIEIEEGFNPRKVFDEQELPELVKSIEEDGLTIPITVRPNGGSKHVLVAGERRLIAARKAALKQVPGLIRSKEGAYAAAFAENEFRANLNPIERGEALKRLASEEGLGTQKKLAERTGKSAAFISTHLRLLKLPPAVQQQSSMARPPFGPLPNPPRSLPAVAVAPEVAQKADERMADSDRDQQDRGDFHRGDITGKGRKGARGRSGLPRRRLSDATCRCF